MVRLLVETSLKKKVVSWMQPQIIYCSGLCIAGQAIILRACVRACMRACVCACMRACVRACVHACVCACVCVCVSLALCITAIASPMYALVDHCIKIGVASLQR